MCVYGTLAYLRVPPSSGGSDTPVCPGCCNGGGGEPSDIASTRLRDDRPGVTGAPGGDSTGCIATSLLPPATSDSPAGAAAPRGVMTAAVAAAAPGPCCPCWAMRDSNLPRGVAGGFDALVLAKPCKPVRFSGLTCVPTCPPKTLLFACRPVPAALLVLVLAVVPVQPLRAAPAAAAAAAVAAAGCSATAPTDPLGVCGTAPDCCDGCVAGTCCVGGRGAARGDGAGMRGEGAGCAAGASPAIHLCARACSGVIRWAGSHCRHACSRSRNPLSAPLSTPDNDLVAAQHTHTHTHTTQTPALKLYAQRLQYSVCARACGGTRARLCVLGYVHGLTRLVHLPVAVWCNAWRASRVKEHFLSARCVD